MKKVIMAALAASSVVVAIGASATAADARPWGYGYRPYHAYWGVYPGFYGYYGPAYYYGPGPYWRGYYRPYFHRGFRRW